MTPEDGWAWRVWALALTAVSLIGLVAGWKRVVIVPWLLFLLSKAVITAAFFGYGRQGATVVPVVALLLGLAVDRLTRAKSLGLKGAIRCPPTGTGTSRSKSAWEGANLRLLANSRHLSLGLLQTAPADNRLSFERTQQGKFERA